MKKLAEIIIAVAVVVTIATLAASALLAGMWLFGGDEQTGKLASAVFAVSRGVMFLGVIIGLLYVGAALDLATFSPSAVSKKDARAQQQNAPKEKDDKDDDGGRI
jgi:hypothetical protein